MYINIKVNKKYYRYRINKIIPIKREAGESPARTRRCKEGILFLPQVVVIAKMRFVSLRERRKTVAKLLNLGRRSKVVISKSEDLPVVRTVRPRGIG